MAMLRREEQLQGLSFGRARASSPRTSLAPPAYCNRPRLRARSITGTPTVCPLPPKLEPADI